VGTIMATNTTFAFPSQAPQGTAAPVAPGQLWQVPVFVTGLLALAAVWVARPLWHGEQPRPRERDLAAAREALNGEHPDVARAIQLARSALDQLPDRAGEAHFLLGSAYLRRTGEAGGEEAAEAWRGAQEHLEQADALGVPDGDRAALAYRLGKVLYHAGADPQRVIAYLARSVDVAADDPGEAYGMLAQAYLKLPTPDVRAALQANKKQLDLPRDNDDLLAPARLLRAQLLLQTQDREEARKALAAIKRGAPPEVYAPARLLLARLYQQDGLWSEAARLWEEARQDKAEVPGGQPRLLYDLGVCYRKTGKEAEADRVLASALGAAGDAGQAAALQLADLRLIGPQPASALGCFDRAVRGLAGPADYHNALVALEEARPLFEKGLQVYRLAGDYASALRLAHLYEKVAPADVAQEAVGQLAEAWAQKCQAAHRDEDARAHWLEAADAYQAVADRATTAPEQSPWLWRAARCAVQAKEPARAASGLKRFLEVETALKDKASPDRLGQGWLALAQVFEAQGEGEAAGAAYAKCLEFPGPFAHRARYQLALALVAQHKPDEAEAVLVQNLELMRPSPDDDAQEKSLFTLADLLFRRGDYRMALLRLDEGLSRFPAHAGATAARLQLAECYRRLSAQEVENSRGERLSPEARAHYRELARDSLEKAADTYQRLAEDLLAHHNAHALPEPEQALLTQAEFAAADCRYDLGKYQEALRLYQLLAVRYHHRVEGLMALRNACRCYWVYPPQPDRARETIAQMRALLKEMDDAALANQLGAWADQLGAWATRQKWEDWLNWAAEQQ
jgi:tetratricopeptide (TPR) repeat protein